MQYHEQPFDSRPERRSFGSTFGGRFTPAVKAIVIVTAAVFVIEMFAFSAAQENHDVFFGGFFGWFALWPARVFARGHVWQLLTYAFLHDPGSILHILFNMLMLYWFGREVERALGTRRFAWFYLTAAVFAGFAFSLVRVFTPLKPCVGASGAVMAVMMAYALYWPNRVVLFMLFIPMRIRTLIIVVTIYEVFSLMSLHNSVANMAHLGGLLYGYLFVKYAPHVARYIRNSRPTRADEDDATDARLDEILAKIHSDGITSLTASERRFLKKMSGRR